MRPDHWIVAFVILALAVFAPHTSLADEDRSRLIDSMLREVNMQRALNGVGVLTINDRLTAAAQKHAEDMAKRDYFDHRSPDGRGYQERIAREGYAWRAIAENLGAGLSSPKSTVNAWMTSPGHRENMLSWDYYDAGIGYVRPSGKGKRPRYAHYWVIVFGARSR